MSVLTFPKGSDEKLSVHFRSREFDCRCVSSACTETLVDQELVRALERMRAELGGAIHINSGYRCPGHQAELTASGHQTSKGTSQHEMGKAADVSSPGTGGMRLEACAHSAGFRSVGVAADWVHVDLRPEPRRWVYLNQARG